MLRNKSYMEISHSKCCGRKNLELLIEIPSNTAQVCKFREAVGLSLSHPTLVAFKYYDLKYELKNIIIFLYHLLDYPMTFLQLALYIIYLSSSLMILLINVWLIFLLDHRHSHFRHFNIPCSILSCHFCKVILKIKWWVGHSGSCL